MDQIEFYDLFKQNSTADLINIVREKDNYQAAAVLAAEQLLRERDVSSTDTEEADNFFREKEMKRMAATARVDSIKAVAADWVEPLARPSTEFQPYKWYRIFLVVYGLSFGWALYKFVRHLIMTRSIAANLFDFTIEDISLALNALILVLLLKRNKWGWILLVVNYTSGMIMQFFAYGSNLHFGRRIVDPTPSLYLGFFYLVIVVFLWRQQMAEFFGVEPVVKRRSLGVGIGIGLIFVLFGLYQLFALHKIQ
jgi:hypothetical protein